MKLFNGPLPTLEHALDLRAQRHEVLSTNLANIDTAGFVAQDVDFETSLHNAQEADDATDASIASSSTTGSREPTAVEMMDAPSLYSTGLDGNTVDLDRTMAALADNGLQYGANARVAARHLGLLRTVVNDGNG